MSTGDQIAQIPGSCGLMDAKSGKSFLVNGLGCENGLNFGTDPAVIDEQITWAETPKGLPELGSGR